MIRRILSILLLLASLGLSAQGLSHEWAHTWGSRANGYSVGQGIGVDTTESTYVAGIFTGTIDLDPGPGLVQVA